MDYKTQFQCDFCSQIKPKEEIHGNGGECYCDENNEPCMECICPTPVTMWWCNACDAGHSHEIRQVVVNEAGHTNYKLIHGFDTKEEAQEAARHFSMWSDDINLVVRQCKP